jgi:hypothetical protein
MGWVVREKVGQGGEITQALYTHMNKRKEQKIKRGGIYKESSIFYQSVSPF